jgi:hypothetical protein
VRIFLHIDNPLAARVQQQLAAGHAWAGCHIGRVDGIHISALHQSILLGVDRLAGIEVRAAWRIPTRASMRVSATEMIGHINIITVRKPSRDAVVPC